jgi:uncharacterized SAM-binding protein YcdF (DUF218 family)
MIRPVGTVRRSLIGAIAAGVVAASLVSALFVFPRTSAPTHADAVVVLSGGRGERVSRALRLLRDGWATTLVLDGDPDPTSRSLCTEPQAFEVVCLRPEHDNTRGEARAAGRLTAARGWRTILVVTSTHHVTRAALLFRRCLRADLDIVGVHPPIGLLKAAKAIAHELLGVMWALAHPGC